MGDSTGGSGDASRTPLAADAAATTATGDEAGAEVDGDTTSNPLAAAGVTTATVGKAGAEVDGDITSNPPAAAAAASTADTTGSGSGMKSGESGHAADDATGSLTKEVAQRPVVNPPSRALSADAPAFHPRQPVAAPAPASFLGPGAPVRPFVFGPGAPAPPLIIGPAAAMGTGSAGHNFNQSAPWPEHRPRSAESSYWPARTRTPAAASAYMGSGSRSPLHSIDVTTSSGSTQERPPGRHPAHNTAAASGAAAAADLHTTQKAARVDNRQLPLHRLAYVPPTPGTSRLNVGPRSQLQPLGSGSHGSTRMPSYSAMARHGSTTPVEIEKLKSKMLDYLNRDDCFYKVQAGAAGVQLKVEFHDIISKDKELALKLCNSQGSGNEFWLQQAAIQFFTENGVSTAKASFCFERMPIRLTYLRDVFKSSEQPLSRPISLCGSRKIVDVTTFFGRQTLDIIMSSTLDRLANGESWRGDILLEDLLMAEDFNGRKLVIAKEPTVKDNATGSEKLDDLWAIWRQVQPFYLIGNDLPLYFERLQNDLLEGRDLDDCFEKYLRYHPVFYASNPRKNVISGFHLVACKSKVPLPAPLYAVFRLPPFEYDWRDSISGSEILSSISSYREREKEKERVKEKERKVEQEKLKEDVGREKTLVDQQYLNTLESLLVFQRNGLQHPYEHAPMSDKDEMELFLAASFVNFLPDLIQILLRSCNMSGEFASDWSTYRASKSDDRDLPFT